LDPLDPGYKRELLASQFGLAQALAAIYQAKEGDVILQAALKTLEALGPTADTELKVLAARAETAILMELQKPKEALIPAERLLALVNAWPQAEPVDQFDARQRLAELHLRLANPTAAKPLLAELEGAKFGGEAIGVVTQARAQMARAKLLHVQGQWDEARTVMASARQTLTKALGPQAFWWPPSTMKLARLPCMRRTMPR
jgi:hypothetical protein